MKSIFVSMFALAALASCSNDNEGIDGPSVPDSQGSGAYLSVAINMPSSLSTRAGDAGPGSEAGTTDESEVKSVYLLLYKAGQRANELRPLTSSEMGTIGKGAVASVSGDAIKVDKEVTEAFVVINPSDKTLDAIRLDLNKSALTNALVESAADLKNSSNGFMMTSDSGFVAVSPVLAATETAAGISAAQAIAKAKPVKMGVDRALAKTKLAVFASTIANTTNGTASVDGWKLNTTNKSYFPYAALAPYTINSASVADAKYRIDPNYTTLPMTGDGEGPAAEAFNWLHNKDYATTSWNPNTDVTLEYALENTMQAGGADQNYNNTTKMIIKAKFAPTGVTLGDSWFRVGGVVKTFDQLNKGYTTASLADKAKYSEFLNKLLTPARTKGWDGEGKAAIVTLADLDAIPNGGYLAATVSSSENYLIEYFQGSVCYYDVNLKHDNRVAAFGLGRWGIVRNNAYTVSINKISQPGLPYVPDPTDPDIVDPSNPEPEDPTPNDQESAFIAVSITVNNWTTWTQGVDL